MKSKLFLFFFLVFGFNNQCSIFDNRDEGFTNLEQKINEICDVLEEYYNDNNSDEQKAKQELKLIDALKKMQIFFMNEVMEVQISSGRINTYQEILKKLNKFFGKKTNKCVKIGEIENCLVEQNNFIKEKIKEYTNEINQQKINIPRVVITQDIWDSIYELENNNLRKQKRFNNFITNYDLILTFNSNIPFFKRVDFILTEEENSREIERYFNYIQDIIGDFSKHSELADIINFYCNKSINPESKYTNKLSPYVDQFIAEPNEKTAENLFNYSGNNEGYLLTTELFLRYYFDPLSKSAEKQKHFFLEFIKEKYDNFAKQNWKDAQRKLEDLYVKISCFCNKVEENITKGNIKNLVEKRSIVKSIRQKYIFDYRSEMVQNIPKKKMEYYEEIYNSLKDCSAHELREILINAGHVILENSGIDHVLSICEKFNNIFMSSFKEDGSEYTLDEKLESYEKIFHTNLDKNLFLNNIQKFLEKPSTDTLQDLFMVKNMDSFDSYAETILPISMVIAVCFRNYCYNPFFKDTMQQQRKIFGLTFSTDTHHDYCLGDIFRTDFEQLYSNSINDRVSIENEEKRGKELFEEFFSSVCNSKSIWKKAALYNLSKHNGSYLSNFLRNRNHTYEEFAQIYKYILRPLISTGLKTGFNNESLFEKTLNTAVTSCSGQGLKHLEKLLNKLESSNKVPENIRNKIASINQEIETKKAREKNKKSQESKYNIWEEKENKIIQYFQDLNEQKIDIKDYRHIMTILDYMRNPSVFPDFPDIYLKANNLKNNKNDIFNELDEYAENVLENNDDIKESQRDYQASYWYEKIKNIGKKAVKSAWKTFQKDGGIQKIIGQLFKGKDANLNNYIEDTNKRFHNEMIDIRYQMLTIFHKSTDTLRAKETFGEINKKLINPYDQKIIDQKLRQMQGI